MLLSVYLLRYPAAPAYNTAKHISLPPFICSRCLNCWGSIFSSGKVNWYITSGVSPWKLLKVVLSFGLFFNLLYNTKPFLQLWMEGNIHTLTQCLLPATTPLLHMLLALDSTDSCPTNRLRCRHFAVSGYIVLTEYCRKYTHFGPFEFPWFTLG